MKKAFFLFVLIFSFKVFALSQELSTEDAQPAAVKSFQNHIIPMLGFQTLQTDEEDFIFSPSVNLQFMRIKSPGVESKAPDLIAIGAGYSMSYHTAGLGQDDVHQLHGCNLMGSLNAGKNSFVAMLASNGQIPFSHTRARFV